MNALKLKKSISNQLLFKVNRSRTWVATISIVDNWTDKKVAYAGGCGYDKQAGCLKDFVYNHFEATPYITLLMNRIDSGMFTSPWDYIKESELERFFNYIGLSVTVQKLDKGKYPVYKIQKMFAWDEKDFKELQDEMIANNAEEYQRLRERGY